MPFGLKNAPLEFQNITNDVIAPISSFAIAYIDDVLIFSKSLDQYASHLSRFHNLIKNNGLVVSTLKMKFFQTHIRFLGHDIHQRTIKPILQRFPKSNQNQTCFRVSGN